MWRQTACDFYLKQEKTERENMFFWLYHLPTSMIYTRIVFFKTCCFYFFSYCFMGLAPFRINKFSACFLLSLSHWKINPNSKAAIWSIRIYQYFLLFFFVFIVQFFFRFHSFNQHFPSLAKNECFYSFVFVCSPNTNRSLWSSMLNRLFDAREKTFRKT